jgi:hypothetical protein
MPVTLLSLTVELILSVGENLRDAHDRPCCQYRDHAYGDFNAFLQVNSKFHEILNPILRKEAAECPRNTTGRVFAHLIRTNNLKSLKSFLTLGVNREAPLRGFGTINPKQDSTIDVFTPLVAAAFLDNVQVVRILLDSGAKVQYDRYNHEDLSYYCAMHAARSEEMVHVLMEYGGDIELVDSEKRTPLHWFSCRNNVAAIYVRGQYGNRSTCGLEPPPPLQCMPFCGLTKWMPLVVNGLTSLTAWERSLRLVWMAARHSTKLPRMAMWRPYQS